MSVGEKSRRQGTRQAVLSASDEVETALAVMSRRAGGWRSDLIAELNRSAVRDRLPFALAGVAFIHLATFAICQTIYVPDGRADYRHPALWFLELTEVLAFLRVALGRGWARSTPAINLVVKLWTTFLVLSFSVVTLNSQTGFVLAWYKPVWATLSTFLFASLAWAFSPWFFVPAVQMWATGLLMVNFIDGAYLIYGVSWWMALMGVAIQLRRRRSLP